MRTVCLIINSVPVCVCIHGLHTRAHTHGTTGETGLGKSTLINTLFRAKISRSSATPGPHAIPPTTEVMSVSHGTWTPIEL